MRQVSVKKIIVILGAVGATLTLVQRAQAGAISPVGTFEEAKSGAAGFAPGAEAATATAMNMKMPSSTNVANRAPAALAKSSVTGSVTGAVTGTATEAAPETSSWMSKVSQSWNSVKSAISAKLGSKPASDDVAKSDGGRSDYKSASSNPQEPFMAHSQAVRAPTVLSARTDTEPQAKPQFSRGPASVDSIQRISLDPVQRIDPKLLALDPEIQDRLDDRLMRAYKSPAVIKDALAHELAKSFVRAEAYHNVQEAGFAPNTPLEIRGVGAVEFHLRPELALKLGNFKALTNEELRFLSALYLTQNGGHCASTLSLLHSIVSKPEWTAEASYYMAMCDKSLGLNGDYFRNFARVLSTADVYYSVRIMQNMGNEIPYAVNEEFARGLQTATANPQIVSQLSPEVMANAAYLMADYNASTEHFKTALQWAQKVPPTHAKYAQARFIEALSEYQGGSKAKAEEIQQELLNAPSTDKANSEFQALVALNAGRIYFQDQKFKEANKTYLMVDKEQSLWLQSLTELGWSQLMAGDFEGAIGNMYSVESPFFRHVYKPESYVIRTIGYLNLCQYGDAYRTLSTLEHDYRPQLEKIDKYLETKGDKSVYSAVRGFLISQNKKDSKDKRAASAEGEVDGLPNPVLREIARHRDFTNWQKALNADIDEFVNYPKIGSEIDNGLKHAEWLVTVSRKRIDELKKNLASLKRHPELEKNRELWTRDLNSEFVALNNHFFQVDLYNDVKSTFVAYRKDVIEKSESRIAETKIKLNKILVDRLVRVKVDLARMLDNNELLRYEVFAGSGENLRFQVAGGERAKRIPASVLPKSKSLQWSFDGEFWEDEIGHIRSGIKNNCPEGSHPAAQANNDGGQQ